MKTMLIIILVILLLIGAIIIGYFLHRELSDRAARQAAIYGVQRLEELFDDVEDELNRFVIYI